MPLVWLLSLAAAAYQLLAIIAALRHLARPRPPRPARAEGVSVLKPLRGVDPNTRTAFLSQVRQRYPVFELVFGAREENDPAAAEVRRLAAGYPDAQIRLVIGAPSTPNGKAGMLISLASHARYPIWIVNDSDIKVDPEYLAEVVAPLENPSIGLVTCLYRVQPHNVPAAWEALGIMTDFMPSTLVAPLVGVREFGLGSTLAFRAEDLARAGGFEAVAPYLADDYQLARRIVSLGKRAVISTYVVETSLGNATWTGIWQHQLRWARTIRASKGAGYAGLPITHAGLWIALALAFSAWPVALALFLLRSLSALLTGGVVLRSRLAAAFCWLAPLWDLYAFAVWLASYAGNTVRWRDETLAIDREGRILR